jgi:hypothetical protein
MLRALPYILAGVLAYLVLFYMESYQPELMTDILIQVDVFGVTRIAKEEQQRLTDIKNLTIPYEEKQVLVNRTVFMGASPDMVKLALGNPQKIVEKIWEGKSVMLTYYVYYLPNDKRPTVLVFQENKLVNAYKDSAINISNY